MRKGEWKNKKMEDWTGADYLWYLIEENDNFVTEQITRWTFKGVIYEIWEYCRVYILDKDGKVLLEKVYDGFEDLMTCKDWNGLSIEETLENIPEKAVEYPGRDDIRPVLPCE